MLSLRQSEKLLYGRMAAFQSAVKTIISKSAHSSGGVADDWARKSKNDISKEVSDFTASLQAVRTKFSSTNPREVAAAKDGYKILAAVNKAVQVKSTAIIDQNAIEKGIDNMKQRQSNLTRIHKKAAVKTA